MQVVGEQPGATLSFETFPFLMGFPGGSDSKASACNVGDLGSIPGSGRSPWRREWQPEAPNDALFSFICVIPIR